MWFRKVSEFRLMAIEDSFRSSVNNWLQSRRREAAKKRERREKNRCIALEFARERRLEFNGSVRRINELLDLKRKDDLREATADNWRRIDEAESTVVPVGFSTGNIPKWMVY